MNSLFQRLLLSFALVAMCGAAHSRQICLPSTDYYVPENYQTQSTGLYSFIAQQGEGVLNQMASTPDEAEGHSFPFERTTTWNGETTTVKKWLTSIGPYRGQDWKSLPYDTTYHFIHTHITVCNSSGCSDTYTFGSFKPVGDGTLEARETIICISPVETPILIQLQGSRHRVPDPKKDPRVDFTLKATIGEYTYPVEQMTVTVENKQTGVPMGNVWCTHPWRCNSTANGQTIQDTAQGPFGEGAQFYYNASDNNAADGAASQTNNTATVRVHCEACQQDVRWDVTVGPPETVIGFFNGVANTIEAAQDSLKRLQSEFGPQYKDSPLKYAQFYNQTACQEGGIPIVNKVPCLDDVAEVFEARTGELNGVFANRWEVFWDILAGRHRQSNSWSGRLIELLGSGGNALLQWMDATANAAFNRLATMFFDMLSLFTNTPTYANQTEHLKRLQQYADEGAQFVMVAHSQGNLFVNTAFDGLKGTRPEARAQVVHVAPASPTLRGDYVLSDIDLVINALRVTGLNSVPDTNIAMPVNLSADFSGHGFEPSYLDKTRAAYARTIGMITASLEALTQ